MLYRQKNKEYLEQAYSKYYYAFIQKAMECFGEQTDKAFDCVQEVMLRLLQVDFEIENSVHARSLIYKSIPWQSSKIKALRKQWGAGREVAYDFTNTDEVERQLTDPVIPAIKGTLDYWPQSNRYFNHISKISRYHQQIIKLLLLGCGNVESIRLLGRKIKKDTYGSAKDAAIKMLRGFRVANTLRTALERSQKRRGTDDRTDRIMEMTAASIPDKEIAERLGLSVNNVKCRRFDRNKLLKKIQEQQ